MGGEKVGLTKLKDSQELSSQFLINKKMRRETRKVRMKYTNDDPNLPMRAHSLLGMQKHGETEEEDHFPVNHSPFSPSGLFFFFSVSFFFFLPSYTSSPI